MLLLLFHLHSIERQTAAATKEERRIYQVTDGLKSPDTK
jgi:hypothetical protein